MEIVNKRRRALTAAASLSGWHIKETGNGGESSIVTEIVEKILDSIESHDMEKKLIGIESRIVALISILDLEATEEVRMVGILGMVGIGKTTLAKALYHRIAHKFEVVALLKMLGKIARVKKAYATYKNRF